MVRKRGFEALLTEELREAFDSVSKRRSPAVLCVAKLQRPFTAIENVRHVLGDR